MLISVPIQVFTLLHLPVPSLHALPKSMMIGLHMAIKSIKGNVILMKVIVNKTKLIDRFNTLCTFE